MRYKNPNQCVKCICSHGPAPSSISNRFKKTQLQYTLVILNLKNAYLNPFVIFRV